MLRFPGRVVGAVSLAALLWLGWRGAGPLPPLGPLIDPVRGAWGLAASAELPSHAEGRIAGLDADVRVLYDDRAVPHIFAGTATAPREPGAGRWPGWWARGRSRRTARPASSGWVAPPSD